MSQPNSASRVSGGRPVHVIILVKGRFFRNHRTPRSTSVPFKTQSQTNNRTLPDHLLLWCYVVFCGDHDYYMLSLSDTCCSGDHLVVIMIIICCFLRWSWLLYVVLHLVCDHASSGASWTAAQTQLCSDQLTTKRKKDLKRTGVWYIDKIWSRVDWSALNIKDW